MLYQYCRNSDMSEYKTSRLGKHHFYRDTIIPERMIFCAEQKSTTVTSYTIMLYYMIRIMYILLPYDDCRKGDVMKRAEIRKYFTEYVKRENLQDGK